MKSISVLLAEDHSVVREGLRALLELNSGFEIVGEASTGREAVSLAIKLLPDVIIMDIAMPGLNGFEATRQIRLSAPNVKVLALSAHSDEQYVSHMSKVGASGFLMKQNSGESLFEAIREVAAGRSYFSSRIAQQMRKVKEKARAEGKPQGKANRSLTKREAEVLQLVAEGFANKQMAAELGISTKTIEKHRQNLMNKLDIHDTAGLTRHAIATGVIEGSVQTTTH